MKGFKNCNIYVEGKGIVKSNLEVENGKIASFNAVDGALELDDKYIVVPGFIDRHIHGANNSDSMYPTLKDIRNICATVASEGVSTFLPTTMTQTVENICKALENIANYIETENDKGAYVLGMHLEGPFISKKHKGAQVESCIIPCSVEKFQIFEKASHGYIKEVTMAYEENGKELANYLHSKGIVASIGHTDATCAEVIEASKNGVTSATHTYNAMKGLHHREAGTVGGVFLCDSIYSELICDLVHVSSDAIKVLYKIKGQDKITLITDGIEAKHLPDGKYKLGGQDVYVKGKEARLALIEYARYVENYYGTPKQYVMEQLEAGKDVILEIEIQGALKVKEKYPDTLLMFVTPPSAQVLKDRLVGRGTETAEVIDSRMKRAVEESQGVEKYDYLVINDDLERCAKEMHSIIQGEHDRVSRNADFIDDIRKELKEL